MVVGICKLDIHILNSPQNLKDKRRIIKGLKDKIANKFNVSVSEIDNHDLWHRSSIGIASVSNIKKVAEEIIYKIIYLIEKEPDIEITEKLIEFINI